MSQHDYILDNQSGANFRSDINNALAAIASANSGATEPTTTYAYQFWADTTNAVLKLRNGSDTAWIEFMDLNTGNIIIKGATAQLKLENTDGDGDHATISASSNGDVTVSSDPTNTGANSQIRFFVDGVEHGRISTGGAVFGDGSSDGIPSTFCITDNSPVIRLTDTDSVSTEIAQMFTDASGRLFLSADPTNVNGSSEVRVMDNSLIVARFRSGVGMDLFDDNHRVVIGGDTCYNRIGYGFDRDTTSTSISSTSLVTAGVAKNYIPRRIDGTTRYRVHMKVRYEISGNNTNADVLGEIRPMYYNGTSYVDMSTLPSVGTPNAVADIGFSDLTYFSGGPSEQRGYITFQMDLTTAALRSDGSANYFTLVPGIKCGQSSTTITVYGWSMSVEEFLF